LPRLIRILFLLTILDDDANFHCEATVMFPDSKLTNPCKTLLFLSFRFALRLHEARRGVRRRTPETTRRL